MKRISPEALAHTDELLAKMRGVASVTSAHLEAWWSTKHRVRRVELFRLLNDLADDGRVVKLPGHRWGLPSSALPAQSVTVTQPMPVPALPRVVATATPYTGNCTVTIGRSGKGTEGVVQVDTAPPTVSVVLNINGRPEDAVTVTGACKERVEAVVRAYQRDAVRGATARPSATVCIGKAPLPKVDTRRRPAPGTVAHKILASLKRGPKTADVMASLLDLNPNTLRGRLSELVAGGWLAKGDDGRWEVIS